MSFAILRRFRRRRPRASDATAHVPHHVSPVRRRLGRRGMGLIEVIVGLGLLAVGIIGMNSLVVSMMRGNLSVRLNDQATRLAAAKIAELRSVSYTTLAVGTTADNWWSAATGSSIVFERKTTIAAGTLAATRAITIKLKWYDRGTRTTTFVSEIAQ